MTAWHGAVCGHRVYGGDECAPCMAISLRSQLESAQALISRQNDAEFKLMSENAALKSQLSAMKIAQEAMGKLEEACRKLVCFEQGRQACRDALEELDRVRGGGE